MVGDFVDCQLLRPISLDTWLAKRIALRMEGYEVQRVEMMPGECPRCHKSEVLILVTFAQDVEAIMFQVCLSCGSAFEELFFEAVGEGFQA